MKAGESMKYIADGGVRFLVTLYGVNVGHETLEEVHYKRFIHSTTKSKLNLASMYNGYCMVCI